jgi:hypothetical protein
MSLLHHVENPHLLPLIICHHESGPSISYLARASHQQAIAAAAGHLKYGATIAITSPTQLSKQAAAATQTNLSLTSVRAIVAAS